MRKSTLLLLLLFLLFVAACTGSVDLSEPGAAGARRASEHFYDLLARGRGAEYVDHLYAARAMDSSMHSQYVDMMAQFLYEQGQATGGILSAKATRDTMVDSTALVFLDVLFADSTREEVMLPLVYSEGRWWMK